jgi:hypothetical protein
METENTETAGAETPQTETPETAESAWIQLFVYENLPGEPHPITAVCE